MSTIARSACFIAFFPIKLLKYIWPYPQTFNLVWECVVGETSQWDTVVVGRLLGCGHMDVESMKRCEGETDLWVVDSGRNNVYAEELAEK